MTNEHSSRLLSIGEFAAATQLTPKALRLYDEQRLMLPASTDSTNGYRYYRSDQVPVGRLIRTLRDMDLSLAQIAEIVSMQGARAETLLRDFAQGIDRRYAREKRAFQAALMLLREPIRSVAPTIEEFERDALTVAVRPFTADRGTFVERFASELRKIKEDALKAGLSPADEAYCSLVDPLSDEEGRLEIVQPVVMTDSVPHGFTFRQFPPSRCAVVTARSAAAHASEFTAAVDALFDWFDRRGYRAIDTPLISINAGDTGLLTKIVWAYEPSSASER